jgi:hypothetical protein
MTNPSPGVLTIEITPASTLDAGLREIAKITLQSFATNQPNSPINFSETPMAELVRNAGGDTSPANCVNGLVIFALGTEGDVTPRAPGNVLSDEAGVDQAGGDGIVNASDVVQIRRFIVGLDIPNPTTNEFQRADTAPRISSGDGQLDSTDTVQVRLYAAGLDPSQPAAGPGAPSIPPLGTAANEGRADKEPGRGMSIASAVASPDSKTSISIEMNGQGNESAASFTLNFDASKLSNPVISLGSGAAASAVLTTNLKEAANGKIAVLVDGSEAFVGSQVVTITFDVAKDATGGDMPLAFTNDLAVRSVSDTEANPLATKYIDGALTISGPAQAGYEISGRILVSNDKGLRNATVTLTDLSGNVRTVTTSTFGYYSFVNVAAGDNYTIAVESKRYVFEPRTIQIAGNLTDVDLMAR